MAKKKIKEEKVKKSLEKENEYLHELKKKSFDVYQYFEFGLNIIERLKNKAYEAYFVGGFVRDFIMKVDFTDIDIATSATPKEMQEIFPSANMQYADMGVITLQDGKYHFEITTFRQEKYEKKVSRKPSHVHYSKKLSEDVIRRDFTVNALAMTPTLEIIDFVNGQKDIKKKQVRIIGNGVKRFKEDPLRMLRGINLVARYNFKINSKTARAIRKTADGLSELSVTRLTTALKEILTAPYGINAVTEMINLNLFKALPIYHKWLVAIYKNYSKLTVDEKFALLFYMQGEIPEHTGFSSSSLAFFRDCIEVATILENKTVDAIVVFNYGPHLLLTANRIVKINNRKYQNQEKAIKKIDKKMVIRDRRDLNFRADELIELLNGKRDARVGTILEELLHKVIMGDLINNNSAIRQEALKMISMDVNVKEEAIVTDNLVNIPTSLLENNVNHQVDIVVEPVNLPIITPVEVLESAIDQEEDLIVLKAEYDFDFKQLYISFIKSFDNYDNLSESQQQEIRYKIGLKVKQALLTNNRQYLKLEEKGLI